MLTNPGLVKRAQRELDQGTGASLDEAADGLVTGTFPDGVVVHWPANAPLRDTRCSCGASPPCRHRVGVALAYRARALAARLAREPLDEPEVPAPTQWSPGDFDDDALQARLGAHAMELAKACRRRGLVARLRGGTEAEPVATAQLATCTVRFLVPRQLAFGRCDCREGDGCHHLALAVWAFRAGAGAGAGAADDERVVELSEAAASPTREAWADARDLGRWALSVGVGGADGLAQRVAHASRPLRERGYVWLLDVLDDLEATRAAYQARSARYRARSWAFGLAELEARVRAATSAGELPAGFVLGQGRPGDTPLDLARLSSLGMRFDADGSNTLCRALLANPDTGDVLVWERLFEARSGAGAASPSKGEALTALDLGGRRVLGYPLASLARGHVLTRAASRRPNGALRLGSGAGDASVVPHTGDLSGVPPGRRVRSLAALWRAWASRPPACLRPRSLGEAVVVLEGGSASEPLFDPSEQTLFATWKDGDENTITVARAHSRVAPHALDAVAAALSGAWGPVRWIAGEVSLAAGSARFDPSLVMADKPVVPELEPNPPPLRALVAPGPRTSSAVAAALEAVVERLVEAAHVGFASLPPGYSDRLAHAADGARELGLLGVAERALAFADSARRSPDASRWADAMIRAWLAAEQGAQVRAVSER